MKKAFFGVALAALGLGIACGGSSNTDTGGGGGGDTDGGGSSNTDGGGGGGGSEGGGGGDTDGGGGGGDSGLTGTRAIKTVFIIMMENHSWSSVKNATYIASLVPMGGHAEAYSTPKGNHPSEPNYIWLEAGDNLGIKDDGLPSANHQATTDHLVTQLEAKGVTWKAYAEGIDGTACPLADTSTAKAYSPKHTPMVFFDDVTETNKAAAKRCIDHVRPYTELATDLAGTTAQYNFITPDLCDDMHGQISGKCNVASDNVKLGDTFLSTAVPAIMASKAYKDSGALFIIWDEGDEPNPLQPASDGPVGMIVLSPLAKTGFASNTAFTHSSTLRTVEEIFGVPLLRGAKTATDLSEFFTTF
jgi:phospholipase C